MNPIRVVAVALLILASPASYAMQAKKTDTLFRNGAYAPVFGELSLLTLPEPDDSERIPAYRGRFGVQVTRTPFMATMIGLSGDTIGGDLSGKSRDQHYYYHSFGPALDLMLFPQADFNANITAIYGKGRIVYKRQKEDDGNTTCHLSQVVDVIGTGLYRVSHSVKLLLGGGYRQYKAQEDIEGGISKTRRSYTVLVGFRGTQL